jgi:hypothetical protein
MSNTSEDSSEEEDIEDITEEAISEDEDNAPTYEEKANEYFLVDHIEDECNDNEFVIISKLEKEYNEGVGVSKHDNSYYLRCFGKPLAEGIPANPAFQDKDGMTPAMRHMERYHELPLPGMEHDPDLVDCRGRNAAMIAVECIRGLKKFPDWMIPSDILKEDRDSENIQMKWIDNQRTAFPDCIKIDPNHKTSKGEVLAHYWIKEKNCKPPDWMICSPDLRNNEGTMSYLWFRYIGLDLPMPICMRHDPTIPATIRFETLAIAWVRKYKTKPPRWMRHDKSLISGNTTMALEWIEKWKSKPPRWMRHDKSLIVDGKTMASVWIEKCKTDPPVCMRHDNTLIVGNKTIAMHCIVNTGKVPSRWMRHDKSLIVNGDTMATCWIFSTRYEPPPFMRHAAELVTKNGTMAMCWIRATEGRKRIPSYMLHAADLVTPEGTMASTWICYSRECEWYGELPSEIKHAPELLAPYETMAMLWVRHKFTSPPDFMKHSPRLKSADGRTVKDFWHRYRGFAPPDWMIEADELKFPMVGCKHVEELSCLTKDGKIVCDKCSTGEAEKIITPHVCGICQDSFILNREVIVYRPCKHMCCKECAKRWYKVNKTCPYCKMDVMSQSFKE